jgi:hypothetical protein
LPGNHGTPDVLRDEAKLSIQELFASAFSNQLADVNMGFEEF